MNVSGGSVPSHSANESASSAASPPLLADLLDLDNLAQMVTEGYVAAKPGPDGLTLYDYTHVIPLGPTSAGTRLDPEPQP